MCGIIGYNGKDKSTLHILIDGLKALEYRGYDSSGIAFKTDRIETIKNTAINFDFICTSFWMFSSEILI